MAETLVADVSTPNADVLLTENLVLFPDTPKLNDIHKTLQTISIVYTS